jgi:hypothetical protein|nr:MAG TPA: hypothetical protein [Caudoviricetes sp.]
MKNLTKEMEGIDLRNLPDDAPLFARVFAEAVGARECAYPEMALHVARLAACFYLRGDDNDKWARYAVNQVLHTRNAHKVVVTWAAVELRSDMDKNPRLDLDMYSLKRNDDGRWCYFVRKLVDGYVDPAYIPRFFTPEIDAMLTEYHKNLAPMYEFPFRGVTRYPQYTGAFPTGEVFYGFPMISTDDDDDD